MRTLISGIDRNKGLFDVPAGRVDQGVVLSRSGDAMVYENAFIIEPNWVELNIILQDQQWIWYKLSTSVHLAMSQFALACFEVPAVNEGVRKYPISLMFLPLV